MRFWKKIMCQFPPVKRGDMWTNKSLYFCFMISIVISWYMYSVFIKISNESYGNRGLGKLIETNMWHISLILNTFD